MPVPPNDGRFVLPLKLAHIKVVIKAPARQELVVLAPLHNAPIVQHQYLVGVTDSTQAVGDDEAGAAGQELLEGFLDQALCARVHAGGGLVKDEDARVCQSGSGDGDQLALSLA